MVRVPAISSSRVRPIRFLFTQPGRWLNQVGMADCHGYGQQDVVAVSTPHIGGVLTLYRYQPPHLVPMALERDVSNHVYGQVE